MSGELFLAACDSLGRIGQALGTDPDAGGHEPILAAIADLRAQRDESLAALKSLMKEVPLALRRGYADPDTLRAFKEADAVLKKAAKP